MIKTYQDHSHCRTYSKCMENEYRFFHGRFLTKKTIIGKPLSSNFDNDDEQGILTLEILY